MAQTVYIKDGTIETIIGNKRQFLENLLLEKLGYDVLSLFNECIEDYQEEIAISKEVAFDHEKAADGYYSMCNDAMENFGIIIELLQEKRINKKKLIEAARHGYDDLYKNM